MKIYPEDYIVSVTFAFADKNGDPITPSAVSAKLYNGADEVVTDFGAVTFTSGDTEVEVMVPAQYNVLGEGEISAARILRVEMTTAAGTIRSSFSYIIEGEFRLVLMNNSFQTIEAADLLARDIPNLNGWASADEATKCVAMIDAYRRLTRIPMRFRAEAVQAGIYEKTDIFAAETVITRSAWPEVTGAEFLTWPAYFRLALRMAQIVEANSQLENDPIASRRRSGIISETVGESSMMLRGGFVDYGVSAETLSRLSGHVYYNHRITRG